RLPDRPFLAGEIGKNLTSLGLDRLLRRLPLLPNLHNFRSVLTPSGPPFRLTSWEAFCPSPGGATWSRPLFSRHHDDRILNGCELSGTARRLPRQPVRNRRQVPDPAVWLQQRTSHPQLGLHRF